MYYGKIPDELKAVSKEYEKIFGFDPNGELSLEFGENSYEFYLGILQECVNKRKDMFEVLEAHGWEFSEDEW